MNFNVNITFLSYFHLNTFFTTNVVKSRLVHKADQHIYDSVFLCNIA